MYVMVFLMAICPEVDLGVPRDFSAGDWWIWLLLGLQSAFYTFASAELLGYLKELLGPSGKLTCIILGKHNV